MIPPPPQVLNGRSQKDVLWCDLKACEDKRGSYFILSRHAPSLIIFECLEGPYTEYPRILYVLK